jgi:hypothetical protein
MQEKPCLGSYFTPVVVATGKGIIFEDTYVMREFPSVTVCQLEELGFFISCFREQAVYDCQHVPAKLLCEERRF